MCGMIDIHCGVEELRTSVVPVGPLESVFRPSRGITGSQLSAEEYMAEER